MDQLATTVRCVRYGEKAADQVADLHLPGVTRPPVVCLLHGGFWRMPYGRDQLARVAEDLAGHGFAVWNLEYARVGGPRATWPATMEDVGMGIDHLAQLVSDGLELDLDRVAVVGHSAGGHLALYEAGRWRDDGRAARRIRPQVVVGLAPVADLALAFESGVGGTVVSELIGGSPSQYPQRYRVASPAEMLPLGVRQIILHGTEDDVVPIDLSRRYMCAARAAGDTAELIELPGVGHMEYLDPDSGAHATLRQWLLACLPRT